MNDVDPCNIVPDHIDPSNKSEVEVVVPKVKRLPAAPAGKNNPKSRRGSSHGKKATSTRRHVTTESEDDLENDCEFYFLLMSHKRLPHLCSL